MTTKEIEMKVYYTQVLGEIHITPVGAGQGRVLAERQRAAGHWQMLSLGSLGSVLCTSQGRARLPNSNQKEWDFGKFHRGLM